MPRFLWAVVAVLLTHGVLAQEEKAIPFAQQVQAAEGVIIATFRGQTENRFQGKKFYRGSFRLQQVAGIYNRHIIYKDNFKVSFWGVAENRMAQLNLVPGESYLLLLKKGPTGFELVQQAQSIYHLQSSLGELYLVSKLYGQDEQNGVLTYPQGQLLMAQRWPQEFSVAEQNGQTKTRDKGRQIASETASSNIPVAASSKNQLTVNHAEKEDAELDDFLNKLWPVVILMFLSLVAKIIQNRQNKTWPAKNSL